MVGGLDPRTGVVSGVPGDAAARETIVRAEVSPAPRRVRAVVGDAHVAWLRGPADLPTAFEAMLAVADREGVPLRAAEWTSAGVSAWVSLPRVPDWERVAAGLSAAGLTVVDPRSADAVACVSVVGDGLTEGGSVLRDVLAVAGVEGCTPRAVSSSAFRITLAVPRDAADGLTRALHRRFCES